MNYCDLKKLIPKDKFDLTPIPTLMEIGEDEIRPILPDLLSWTADMNWPVATEIVKVLVRFPNSVIPLIKGILKPTETDEDWKWFIISGLIPEFPISSQTLLTEDIERIINNPTEGEIFSEVPEQARDYIEKLQPQ